MFHRQNFNSQKILNILKWLLLIFFVIDLMWGPNGIRGRYIAMFLDKFSPFYFNNLWIMENLFWAISAIFIYSIIFGMFTIIGIGLFCAPITPLFKLFIKIANQWLFVSRKRLWLLVIFTGLTVSFAGDFLDPHLKVCMDYFQGIETNI
mgnify:CR=1 FL=1